MMKNTFFVISDICLKAAIEHANSYMKYIGFTSKIEIVDCGKTKSMLNLITIKWSDNTVRMCLHNFQNMCMMLILTVMVLKV